MKAKIAALLAVSWALVAHAENVTVASVKLSLEEYLRLDRQAREAEQAEAQAAAKKEPSVADIVAQQRQIIVRDEIAEIHQSYEIELRGTPAKTATLPVTGFAWRANGQPSGLVLSGAPGGIVVAAEAAGRYRVTVDSVAPLVDGGGVRRLRLAPDAAPVAVTGIELDAELGWSCPGAVLAEDEVQAGRRSLRLATGRGQERVLELRREVRGGEAERTFAQSVVVTMIGVGSSGASRDDIVLYEVARGGLDELAVELPGGLEPDRLATDEGEQPTVSDGDRLVVQRQERLTGAGWLALSTPLEVATELDLAQLEPAVGARARYLVLAASVPVSFEPATTSWGRIDVTDLPQVIAEHAAALDIVAAWRWTGERAGLSRVAVATMPPAEVQPSVIRRRDSTTVLTVEGTLVHRDRMQVQTTGSALPVTVSAGSTLWSASVDGVAVRPVERHGETLIPVPFRTGETAEVEVVLVAERAVPEGRTVVDLSLPELAIPVLAHSWRVVLPEGKRYRFRDGDLKPVGGPGEIVRQPTRVAQAPPSPSVQRKINEGGGGTIEGVVLDNEGLPLPGVTVMASSSALVGGPQATISGADGSFRFNLLPSGFYRVEAGLVGFRPVEAQLNVATDRRSKVTFNLIPDPEIFNGEILVTGETPVVDYSSTVTGITVSSSDLQRRHSGRRARARARERESKASSETLPVLGVNSDYLDYEDLKQGLVSGVRPLPVTIPETGKVLTLEGALPPPQVSLSLEVKKGKR